MKLHPKLLLVAALLVLSFGCMKDTVKTRYTIYTAVLKTLAQQRSLIGNTAPTSLVQTGKIYIKDNWIFINEKDKGIHVIDNSDPSQPKNVAFWNIPGNRDLAIERNILYADVYCDIATIDITDPNHIVVKNFLTNIDPSRLYVYTTTTNPDSILVVTGVIKKDTTVTNDLYRPSGNCAYCSINATPSGITPAAYSASASATTGMGSSMQRFTILNNHLFDVGGYALNSIDISSPLNPVLSSSTYISTTIETIYPFQNNIFIGTTTGMMVFDVSSPSKPEQLSWTAHWCMGDPVITDGKYAYVTLSGTRACHATFNQLEIFDVTDIVAPVALKSYPFTSPAGLSKDGNLLFICDATDGLQILDASDVHNLKVVGHIKDINALDVITGNGRALVITNNALMQYDYSNLGDIRLLSKISAGE